MERSNRRRARAAAQDPDATRTRPRWADLEPIPDKLSKRTSLEQSQSFVSPYRDRFGSSSARNAGVSSSSRAQNEFPHWLADAYADLDETRTQSTSPLGDDPLSANRSANHFDHRYDRRLGNDERMEAERPGPRPTSRMDETTQRQRLDRRQVPESLRDWSNDPETDSRAGERDTEKDKKEKKTPKGGHLALKVGIAAFALVICAGAFMYPTVQSYYKTMREHDRLEAEYQAVKERNEALQDSISSLSTNEGVAAYAHEQYGWVMPGEQSVSVQGLEVAPSDGLENVNASVLSGTIKPPETWYSPFLDKFFGVEY